MSNNIPCQDIFTSFIFAIDLISPGEFNLGVESGISQKYQFSGNLLHFIHGEEFLIDLI